MAIPKCPYFGTCGGCMFQHIEYANQLEQKKQELMHAVKVTDAEVIAGKEYGYRNRMDFIFSKQGIAFRQQRGWNKFVEIESCAISVPRINELLAGIREFFKDADYFDLEKKTGTYKCAIIRAPQEESSISFVLNEDARNYGKAIDRIKEFAKTSSAHHIMIIPVIAKTEEITSENGFMVKGEEFLTESIMGKKFKYHLQGFFQNNSKMAEELHKKVHALLKTYASKDTTLLDLYGGVGTFGIVNAELFKESLTIESFPGCIDAAHENITLNGIKNAKAQVLDATYLERITLPKDLVVVTDPPRSGMHPKTIKALVAAKPKAIIYVSCNVQQLAKEISHFHEYLIKSATVVDLFPQTPHSEAIVELVKK